MRAILLFCALLAFCQPFVYGADEGRVLLNLTDTPPEGRAMLAFASELYNSREYYRAITEFLRFSSYFPKSPLSGETGFFIAESYANSEKWDDAIKAYLDFLTVSAKSVLTQDVEYRLLFSCIQKGDYPAAGGIYKKIEDEGAAHKWLDEARYLNVLGLISRREWDNAVKEIDNYLGKPEPSGYGDKYKLLRTEISGHRSLPEKSPLRAGICSALLPGAGQFYARRPGDGVTAFLLTAISLATALNCHANNADFGTFIFSVFTVSFYTANIYNAMNGAMKFNEDVNRKFYLKILDAAKDRKAFWTLHMGLTPERNSLILRYEY